VNEHDLVKNAASGDSRAFEQLIIPYEKPIYNFCLRMLGDTYDAQDISQEVFVKVYKNLQKYQVRNNGSFKSWVYTIANNSCIDEIRKRKVRGQPESLDAEIESDDGEMTRQIESDEPSPEEAFVNMERQNSIKKAISELPPDFRQMIVLRDIRGFSYEEIAKITGIKIGTVKSKISRARIYLKEQFIKNYV